MEKFANENQIKSILPITKRYFENEFIWHNWAVQTLSHVIRGKRRAPQRSHSAPPSPHKDGNFDNYLQRFQAAPRVDTEATSHNRNNYLPLYNGV